ncbi:MAG: NERD domain-containing protein [Myxococcota bacterium]
MGYHPSMLPLPGLYPAGGPRLDASPAERAVYESLKKRLPQGWYAWHSLRLRTRKGMDLEADFIIADPRRGLVVLEVKGGRMRAEDGRWYQNDRLLARAPMEQARGFAHALHKRLSSMDAPAPFGSAVCFPDSVFDEEPSQDDLRGLCLGGQDLPYLDQILPGVMANALPSGRTPNENGWIEKIHALWGEAWVPHASLGTLAAVERGTWLKLTSTQHYVLGELGLKKRVLLTGVAGSGKTMLAAEAARREASAGRRVLYLCFTQGLALSMASHLQPIGVRCLTFGRLALDVVRSGTGEALLDESSNDQEQWDRLACEAAEILEQGAGVAEWPEVVVVDEAQDLTENLWRFVDHLAKSPCRLFVFQDLAQRFWKERGLDEEGVDRLGLDTMSLPVSKRCPPGIADLAERFAGRDFDETRVAEAVASGRIRLVPCSQSASVADAVGREIGRLLAEKLKPEEIFVVSLRGKTAEGSICRHEILGGHPVVSVDDPKMGESVVADTFLRVKGLERPAVIVTDLRLLQERRDEGQCEDRRDVRMHIALTRAMLAVRIVAPRELLEADPLLAEFL